MTSQLDPDTVNRDRREWLAAAIMRDADSYGRRSAARRMRDELRRLEGEAIGAGWLAPHEALLLKRDARDLAWVA